MDALQRGIITLIRSGITGEQLKLPTAFDLEKAAFQLKRHQIQPLGYLGEPVKARLAFVTGINGEQIELFRIYEV